MDFGASDGPMTDEQLAQAKIKILHIPTVLGAVVPAYNIPGVTGEMKFTPEALAGIFLGKITTWNDPAIAKANPGVKLPDQSDHRGPSFRRQRHDLHLHGLSFQGQSGVGRAGRAKELRSSGPSVWVARATKALPDMIRQMQGAIGYIELIYAVQNKIDYGSSRTPPGIREGFLESVTAAAASAKSMPADFRVSITNAPGKEPIRFPASPGC